jgi:hypothetical protein
MVGPALIFVALIVICATEIPYFDGAYGNLRHKNWITYFLWWVPQKSYFCATKRNHPYLVVGSPYLCDAYNYMRHRNTYFYDAYSLHAPQNSQLFVARMICMRHWLYSVAQALAIFCGICTSYAL